ncbi:MAG: hypothetical protein Q4F88_02145 [Eubacteriales bacterium]|nr:hypothetical protein [Eubacteriales bacterium]
MSEWDAVNLSSVWRFSSIFLISLFFILGFLFINIIINYKKMNISFLLCLLFIVFSLSLSIYFANGVNYLPKSILYSDDYIYKKDFDIMENFPANKKILIVAQADQGLLGSIFKFKMFDKKFRSCSFGDPIYHPKDIWTKNLIKEDFIKTIKQYDYIYFYKTDDNFILNYGDIFSIPIIDREDVYIVNDIIK